MDRQRSATRYLPSLRLRVLRFAGGAAATVAGVWVASVALAQVPSFMTVFLVLALGASWCGRRIECVLCNRGATPMRHVGFLDGLRAKLATHHTAPEAAETTTAPVAVSASSDDDFPAVTEPTVATHTDELFAVRQLLAQEREVTASFTDGLTIEQLGLDWDGE